MSSVSCEGGAVKAGGEPCERCAGRKVVVFSGCYVVPCPSCAPDPAPAPPARPRRRPLFTATIAGDVIDAHHDLDTLAGQLRDTFPEVRDDVALWRKEGGVRTLVGVIRPVEGGGTVVAYL